MKPKKSLSWMIGRNEAGGINAYLAEEGMWPEQPYSELLRIAFGMKGVIGGTASPDYGTVQFSHVTFNKGSVLNLDRR